MPGESGDGCFGKRWSADLDQIRSGGADKIRGSTFLPAGEGRNGGDKVRSCHVMLSGDTHGLCNINVDIDIDILGYSSIAFCLSLYLSCF